LKLAVEEKWCAAFLKADTFWDWVQPGGAKVGFPHVRGPVCHLVWFCLMLYLLLLEKKG
jgi:hypothetical protein